MFVLMVAALQVKVINFPPLPPAGPPPPPFSKRVETAALRIGLRVDGEFKRCGDARTNSNGRYVEAMGTPRFSAEWKKAALAMNNALTVCRGLRRALREQQDFLVGVAQKGTTHDADLASDQLENVSSELQATEQYFVTEAPRYHELVTVGWGNPHCVEQPDGYMPAYSICPKGTRASQP